MRRIEPFLFRCAELDKLGAIRQVVGTIMDNLLYSPKLFEIAEMLLAQGRHDAALLLYEGVAEAEKYQHSERLAICQYRIFTIQMGDDQSRNIKAAILFDPYVERLDELARKMRDKAEIQYTLKHEQKSRERMNLLRS